MKKRKSNYILAIMFIAGLSLLLYPSFAEWWNSSRSTKAIQEYSTEVSMLTEEQYKKLWDDAIKYNKRLAAEGQTFALDSDRKREYNKQLNIGKNNVIGYVEIDRLSINLPIYHGTSDTVLGNGAGHLEWSSLPVGGKSSHCVLSGHRGLPSARLFTDIDELKEGDLFRLNVLNETLVYEVDQIRTVLPDNTKDLLIEKGKDYCTLVTCTPYGINTHRLLVRGHRIENYDDSRIANEAVRLEPVYVASAMSIVILICIILIFINRTRRDENEEKEQRLIAVKTYINKRKNS